MTHASYCKLVPPRASFAQDTSPDEVKRMTDQDPAILAGHGHQYEIHPMPFGAVSRPTA